MKVIAILQPHYLPWVGYFNLIKRVDEFIFLDDVQFIKREWKNRNRIRKDFNSDHSKWLSIPINGEDQKGKKNLTETRICFKKNWIDEHLNSIKQVYNHTPYFDFFSLNYQIF